MSRAGGVKRKVFYRVNPPSSKEKAWARKSVQNYLKLHAEMSDLVLRYLKDPNF